MRLRLQTVKRKTTVDSRGTVKFSVSQIYLFKLRFYYLIITSIDDYQNPLKIGRNWESISRLFLNLSISGQVQPTVNDLPIDLLLNISFAICHFSDSFAYFFFIFVPAIGNAKWKTDS